MSATTQVLAHAGGFSWDEALLVMAPIVVIGGLLWLANRRAARLGEQGDQVDAPAGGAADYPVSPAEPPA